MGGPTKYLFTYCIVASFNTYYKLGNKVFVKRLQYIRIENPLYKQFEKACKRC